MRVAEVWMDEYKEDFYISRPNLVGKNFGDVSEMKAIREACNSDKDRNSFKWFMDNVAYDLPKYYPRPHRNVIWGEVRSFESLPLHSQQNETPCFVLVSKYGWQ